MQPFHVRLAIFVLLCLTFLACGGGGGGGGGGGVSVNLQPSSATVGRNGQVAFTATVSNATDRSVTWSATGGTISPTGSNSATYTAPNSDGAFTVTATSTEDPTKSDSSTVTVVVGVATVTGRVIRSTTSTGIAGVIVEFRDNTGAAVQTATTNSSGNFSSAVPLTAVRFHIQNSSIPAGFYKQYNYNSLRYATTIATCSAPLPALSEGANTPLLTDLVIAPTTTPPPPPPNGCQ